MVFVRGIAAQSLYKNRQTIRHDQRNHKLLQGRLWITYLILKVCIMVCINLNSAVIHIKMCGMWDIDKEIAIYLGVGGVFGALIGAFLAGLIPTLIIDFLHQSRDVSTTETWVAFAREMWRVFGRQKKMGWEGWWTKNPLFFLFFIFKKCVMKWRQNGHSSRGAGTMHRV